jgi:hypothetical protein
MTLCGQVPRNGLTGIWPTSPQSCGENPNLNLKNPLVVLAYNMPGLLVGVEPQVF